MSIEERDVVGIGDWVEFPIGSRQFHLVVDLNPESCTPPSIPTVMLARKTSNKVQEGVVMTVHVRKLKLCG